MLSLACAEGDEQKMNDGSELHSPHSAEYFGPTRDHWWNRDFLELMARRLRFDAVREVLDVGSGLGHWGRALSQVLPPEARITGVDNEPTWVRRSNAAAAGLGGRFRYVEGDMHALPFDEGTFDCVTCQTALIHSAEPATVVAEMVRVTRPGGFVLAVEPNNLSNTLLGVAAAFEAPVDEVVALVRFQMICERGKAALGLGNNSTGEVVPALFERQGLEEIRVFANDKANTLLPPYASAEQRAFVEETVELDRRGHALWSREETAKYFRAGGGTEPELERYWALALSRRKADVAAMAAGTYTAAGGAVTYLVSGRKSAGAPTPT
jgi:SAM-dependent methyltransferase